MREGRRVIPILPTWTCAICHQPRLMDRVAEACDHCDQIVCAGCWSAEAARCDECADALYVDDETVADTLRARPGLIADDLWRVIRWAWLAEHRGQRGPAPRWWWDRVVALLHSLRRLGIVECAHGDRCVYQRHTDLGPLCEWRVTEEFRRASA